MRKRKLLVILFAVCIAVVGCSTLQRVGFTQSNNSATMEVVEFDSGENNVIILRATLKAPRGTKVTDISGISPNEFTVESNQNQLLLIAQIYQLSRVSTRDPIIHSSYYALSFNAVDGVDIIETLRLDPDDNIREYATFAEPGTYALTEGEEFVMAEINDKKLGIVITEWPNED